jgi:hypothetical protein
VLRESIVSAHISFSSPTTELAVNSNTPTSTRVR